jgi:serpin B
MLCCYRESLFSVIITRVIEEVLMKKTWTSSIMVLLCALVVACGPVSIETSQTLPLTMPSTNPVASITPATSTLPVNTANPVSLLALLKSDRARNLSPVVTASALQALADGNSAFAWNLYQQLIKDEKGNLFFSPYSLSLALAMAYAGAKGDTAKQMADTLHFTLSQDKLAEAFNYVGLELAKRALMKDLAGKDGHGFRLNVVDDAWGQKDYTFLAGYLDILAENYGAGLRTLDFAKNPEGSRQTINQYISDMTEGRIKDLIPPGGILPFTVLVLTNAIYFNAAWLYPFSETATNDGSFNLADGSKVTVPMMRIGEDFKYYNGNGYQAVELPYVGNALAMDIILPDAGKFTSIEGSLNSQLVQDMTTKLSLTDVRLTMPKFEYSSSFQLGKTLSDMGMPLALSSGADFSGIDGKRDLWIGAVIHKSFVSVDEAGTEAAAASAVMILGAAPNQPKPVELTVDHPFIFLIRDIPTGAILFIGRVMNPAA